MLCFSDGSLGFCFGLFFSLGDDRSSLGVCFFLYFVLDTLCVLMGFDYGFLCELFEGFYMLEFACEFVILVNEVANEREYLSLI